MFGRPYAIRKLSCRGHLGKLHLDNHAIPQFKYPHFGIESQYKIKAGYPSLSRLTHREEQMEAQQVRTLKHFGISPSAD